jgi:hypothetical protein
VICRSINPVGPAVPLFGHLSHNLSAISGLGDRFDLIFSLIGTRLDRPAEPLSFWFEHLNHCFGKWSKDMSDLFCLSEQELHSPQTLVAI